MRFRSSSNSRARRWRVPITALSAAIALAIAGAVTVNPLAASAVTAVDATPPGPASQVLGAAGPTSAWLQWTNPTASDLSGVMIRRASGAVAPTLTSGTLLSTTAKTDTSFYDSGLAKSTQYSYALFARDTSGNYAPAATKTISTTTPATCQSTAAQLTSAGKVAVQVVVFGSSGKPDPLAAARGAQLWFIAPAADGPSYTLTTGPTGFATSPAIAAGSLFTVLGHGNPPGLKFFGSQGVAINAGECTLVEIGATELPAPGPVTGVVANVTTTSIRLSWTNPTAYQFSGVMIRRATGATAPTLTTGTLVVNTLATDTSFTDAHLARATQYTYALFAHTGAPNYGPGIAKTESTTTAATCQSTTTLLATKGAIAAQVVVFGATGQRLAATAGAGAEVEVITGQAGPRVSDLRTNASGFAATAPLSASAAGTAYTVRGLGQEEPPGLLVSGTQAVSLVPGECVLSEVAATPIPAPAISANLVATVTTTSVRLSWKNPTAADFTGVMIRRAAGPTPPTLTTGTLVTDTAKTATSFTDAHLGAASQYSYAIFAHNATPSYASAATKTVTTTTAATCQKTTAQLATTGAIAIRVIVYGADGKPAATPSPAGLAVQVRTAPAGALVGSYSTNSTGYAYTAPVAASAAGVQYTVAGQGGTPILQLLGTQAVGLVPGECVLAELAATPIPDTTAPAPPGQVTAMMGTTSTYLSWVNPTASDFTGVTIRRAVGSTAPTLTTGTLVADTGASQISVTDAHLAAATTYTYALFAHDNAGNYAAPVRKTEATTTAATCKTTAAKLGTNGALAVQILGFGADGQRDTSVAVGGGVIEILAEPSDAPLLQLTTNSSGWAVTTLGAVSYGASYSAYGYAADGSTPGLTVSGFQSILLVPGECVLAEFSGKRS